MDTSHVAHICRTLALGQPVTEPQPVTGGLLHAIWRLTTTQGTFAVKVLNPAILRKPGIHEGYRLSEQISASLAASGIPAISALPGKDGNPLLPVAGSMVLVYPWIEGEVLSSAPQPPERASQIGRILGKIHTTHLEIPALEPPGWNHFSADEWDMLTFQAVDQALPWTYPVRALLNRLSEWSGWYDQAAERLSQHLVVSHRDLDQKNVIWQDATSPYLIDWEAVGLINPTMELAAVALSWSGQNVGIPHKATFSALVTAYYESGGTLTATGLDAVHGVMGTWLSWLLFNMRRSLGESISSEEERQIGIRETTATLAILRNLAQHAETSAAWLEESR